MRAAANAIKLVGTAIALTPLLLLLAVGLFAHVAHPADQTGWGAALGGLLIISMGAVPIGLIVALFGFALDAGGGDTKP
jgi:hypothetical protein